MDLEFHQIDLRYEHLRKQDAAKERALLASLDMLGQACPVVVLAQEAAASFILVDGYKRLRVLKRLHRDTVRATVWDLEEAEALLLERMLRTSRSESQLEQGWLLCELRHRFGLTLEELGDRFERTPSWVSRRLGLVRDLPEAIQEEVRRGRLPILP
jgi:ParB-like chromosome segregation protein Spo0J